MKRILFALAIIASSNWASAQSIDQVRGQIQNIENALYSPTATYLDPQRLQRIAQLLGEVQQLTYVEDLCTGTFRGVALGAQMDITLTRTGNNQIQATTNFKGKPHVGYGTCNPNWDGFHADFYLQYKADSFSYNTVISRNPNNGVVEIRGTFNGYKIY